MKEKPVERNISSSEKSLPYFQFFLPIIYLSFRSDILNSRYYPIEGGWSRSLTFRVFDPQLCSGVITRFPLSSNITKTTLPYDTVILSSRVDLEITPVLLWNDFNFLQDFLKWCIKSKLIMRTWLELQTVKSEILYLGLHVVKN